MGRKRTPGIYKRKGVWHIDKKFLGRRICESTGAASLEEAEKFLACRLDELRNEKVYGIRPRRTFREAAAKYLIENQHKASIHDDAGRLKPLIPFIGDLPLDVINMGSLQQFIEVRRKEGRKTRTINHALELVRRILNLAAREWIDEDNLTWLNSTPKIKMLIETDLRESYPLNWEEQDKLFANLAPHLQNMALFAVNTGCRDRVICSLLWKWEHKLNSRSVFVVPKQYVKNRQDRLIVLNDTAQKVIDSIRGNHDIYVFTFRGKPINRMNNNGWRNARRKAGLEHVRVHDLKHTFGRRLRSAGVSLEDRADLLGHKTGRMTTHYSAAELENLINAANSVNDREKSGVLLRAVPALSSSSRKTPARAVGNFSGDGVSL
jgi:integrase